MRDLFEREASICKGKVDVGNNVETLFSILRHRLTILIIGKQKEHLAFDIPLLCKDLLIANKCMYSVYRRFNSYFTLRQLITSALVEKSRELED